jgi:myo-inositol-1(or 4)-monophosphatase
MSPEDISSYVKFVQKLATAAGAETLPKFRNLASVENKKDGGGFDPVTVADRAAEDAIRALIKKTYPDHGILGEERGTEEGVSAFTWVIDPIDGTRSFITGIPTWGTLIALNDGDRPVVGLMDQPYLDEQYVGAPGRATMTRRSETRALAVSNQKDIHDAVFSTTTPEMFATPEKKEVYETITSTVRLNRFGLDSYAYCLLASGLIDLVVESGLAPYDIQALIPIVEGAGGRVTTWTGSDAQNGGDVVAAATPELLQAALTILGPASEA